MASSTFPGISSGLNRDILLVGAFKCSVGRLRRTFKDPGQRRNQHLQSHRQLSLTASISPSLTPLPLELSTPPHPSVYSAVPEHTMLYQSEIIIIGATMSLLTLLLTGRFLLSFFHLEKMAKQHNGPIAFQYLVMLDSCLDPMMNSKDAESDTPNYAAIVYLASIGAALQLLVGIQFDQIPDTQLLVLLQIILIQKPSILLPKWSMTVFRGFKIVIIGVIFYHLGKELANSR